MQLPYQHLHAKFTSREAPAVSLDSTTQITWALREVLLPQGLSAYRLLPLQKSHIRLFT